MIKKNRDCKTTSSNGIARADPKTSILSDQLTGGGTHNIGNGDGIYESRFVYGHHISTKLVKKIG